MFGYIHTDDPYLFKKDERLYQALYCGLCKGIGDGCGQMCRTALTYDVTFLSAFLHNVTGKDVTIKKQHCIVHPFRKRPMALRDDLTVLLGFINTTLAYYKLLDDKQDGDKKGLFTFLYQKGFKRAVKHHPQVVEIVKKHTTAQRELEQNGCDSVDRACDPTAQMVADLAQYALGDSGTQATKQLCYAVGKWVYLADAVDDYDKDVKKGSYNVLYKAYGCPSKAELVATQKEDLTFLFDSLFVQMRQALSQVKFHFNHDLTDNIILRGIPVTTRRLLYGTPKKEEL